MHYFGTSSLRDHKPILTTLVDYILYEAVECVLEWGVNECYVNVE